MSEETSVFGLRVSSNARNWTVHLAGQLDVAQSAVLLDAAMALRQCDLAAVSFDLGQVTFLDSTGLGALLEVRRQGVALTLRNPQGRVRRLLDLVMIDGLVPVEYD